MARVLLALGVLLQAACFSPKIDDGRVQCGPGGECPPGFRCAPDGRCYRGDGAAGDASSSDASPVDATTPDASSIDGAPADAPTDDARPPGEIAPDQFGLYGGGGGLGNTVQTGKSKSVLNVGAPAVGRSGQAGTTKTVEWGLMPSVKVE